MATYLGLAGIAGHNPDDNHRYNQLLLQLGAEGMLMEFERYIDAEDLKEIIAQAEGRLEENKIELISKKAAHGLTPNELFTTPFVEVKNDYYEEGDDRADGIGARYIDTYISDDDEDAGISVATINDDGVVVFHNGFIKPNPEIHQNVLESIAEAKNMAMKAKQELVDKCIEQIKKDVNGGDVTALDEMLMLVSKKILKAYLPED